MRSLRVLFLPQIGKGSENQRQLVEAVGDKHDLHIYDHALPLEQQFNDIEVVIDTGGSIGTRKMMDAAKDATVWQVMGTGLDHVDLDYLASCGFTVTHCPGTLSAVAMAEAAILFMLMISRFRNEAIDVFERSGMSKPVGVNLEGKVLGLVGFGSSAQELAIRARAFGMRVFAVDVRDIESEVLNFISPEFMGKPGDLDYVVGESDFLSIHLHLNNSTRHIINGRILSLMKPTASLINVARGALVDEKALYESLLSGAIWGAGLDVFDDEPPDPCLPVYQLPNVYVMPHIAGTTINTAIGRASVMAQNLDRIGQGLEPMHQVHPGIKL